MWRLSPMKQQLIWQHTLTQHAPQTAAAALQVTAHMMWRQPTPLSGSRPSPAQALGLGRVLQNQRQFSAALHTAPLKPPRHAQLQAAQMSPQQLGRAKRGSAVKLMQHERSLLLQLQLTARDGDSA